MVSQREDSVNQYTSANRIDLAESEQKEIEILKEFLPKELTDNEFNQLCDSLAFNASQELLD